MSNKQQTVVSKALTYLLRHGAEKEGLSIGADGYVILQDILNHRRIKSHKVSLTDVKQILANCEK